MQTRSIKLYKNKARKSSSLSLIFESRRFSNENRSRRQSGSREPGRLCLSNRSDAIKRYVHNRLT